MLLDFSALRKVDATARPTSGALSSQFSLLAAIKSCVVLLNRLILFFEESFVNVQVSSQRSSTSAYIGIPAENNTTQCRCPNNDTAAKGPSEKFTALENTARLAFQCYHIRPPAASAMMRRSNSLSVAYIEIDISADTYYNLWRERDHTSVKTKIQ